MSEHTQPRGPETVSLICEGSGKRVEWKGNHQHMHRQCPDCGRVIAFHTSPTQMRERKKHSNRLVGWYNVLPAHNRDHGLTRRNESGTARSVASLFPVGLVPPK